MLNASDFQYIYTNGTLPEGKKLLTVEEIKYNVKGDDKASREWISIEVKIYSLAKSLLEKEFPRSTPKEFNLWIQYNENYMKLKDDFEFQLKYVGKHQDDRTFCVSFK